MSGLDKGVQHTDYLEYKDDVYLLIDNIDKGWPTRGAKTEDILIIRTLLEATRKIQRQLEDREVNFHCLVFLRNDIYENLIIETPDKGKDTAINLDMTDPEFYKNLYRLRVISTELVSGNFDEVWGSVFDPFIKTKDSFSYILDLTLKRPRDFLNMIHRSIEVAINRGNERVSQEDMLQAEKMYSDDMIKSISFELQDVYPQANDVLYRFIGCNTKLSETEVKVAILESGIEEKELDRAIVLLVWFGFLGVQTRGEDYVNYSYEMSYDLNKIMLPIKNNHGDFIIHPAFRNVLGCTNKF